MRFLFATPLFALAGIFCLAVTARAQHSAIPKFLGAQDCSSAMCHGGAGEKSHQFTLWSKQDAHARAQSTLTTARAARLADVLKIGDATASARCTSCHAPFADLPADRMANKLRATEGVSCESCHGPAEHWVRAHTRTDYSHADRVRAGVRDLHNLYVRANSCVACHENLEPALQAAGHPELIFELDGQAVSQPRHWREKGEYQGPQAWLTGQIVALREMSWQLTQEKKVEQRLVQRWQGQVWLLSKLSDLDKALAPLPRTVSSPSAAAYEEVQKSADQSAKAVAEMTWTEKETRECITRLAKTAADFRDSKIPEGIHARRAERLVLALDRLTGALDKAASGPLEADLQKLFQLAQSTSGFNEGAFAQALDVLGKKL